MKRLGLMTAGLLGFALSLSAVGCGPSQGEIEQEFAAFVDSVNHCNEDRECAFASPGCPLGCWVAVPVTARERVEAKARELIDDLYGSGQGCAYGCTEQGEVTCTEGRCTSGQ